MDRGLAKLRARRGPGNPVVELIPGVERPAGCERPEEVACTTAEASRNPLS